MYRKTSFLLLVILIVLSMPLSVVSAQEDAAPVPDILTLPDEVAGGESVTITVSGMPSADRPEDLAVWQATADRFMELYPNVTIEGLELDYDTAAYTALVAGNQLPTLFGSWFTEPPKFIDQEAVADLTPYLEAAGVLDVFNPAVLNVMERDGSIYGIPHNAYALGLAYNIPMLEAAGFDAPPETWEELAEMAVALTDRDNNISGFSFVTDGGAATGWHFTDIAYGFGATAQDIIQDNGDGTYTATFGEGATVEAMEYVQSLRWEYDVLPGAALNSDASVEAFVTGRVAMIITAGDNFGRIYTRFDDADMSQFGYAAAPAGPDGKVTLSGGNLFMVSGSATPAEQEAATYFQLWRQFDPVQMQDDIEVTTSVVGNPMLPMYVGEYQEAYEAFREPYNNLPVENYAAFLDAVIGGEVTVQAEPTPDVQDYYVEMGALVSEILTSENVDITSRLQEIAEEFQAFVLDR